MKKLITVCQVLVIAAVVSTLAFAEQIIQATEAMVGAHHATLPDTLNRGFLIQHNAEGVHTVVPYSVLTGVPTTFPYDNLTGIPTTFPYDNLTGPRSSFPYDNLTGVPTTFPYDNLTGVPAAYSVADNSITPAKLSKSSGTADNTTFYRGDGAWGDPGVDVQAQLDLKQALDADLTVLSFPTAWRIFYSNGSQAITELALGASNTYLKSNGASSAPTFSTVTAVGNADTATALAANGANCSAGQAPLGVNASGVAEGCWTPAANLDNTTMDNTVIGGTTPAAITGTTGTFTSLTRGTVSNTEFGYIDGLTSSAQGQLNLKRALDNVTFAGAGVATFDNEVTATQFNSSGADNTHFLDITNTAAPFTCDNTVGRRGVIYSDNTANALMYCDGVSWGASAGTVTPSTTDTFTNKTYDPSGLGNVFTHYAQKDFTILDPVAADNSMLFKARYAMTVSAIHCFAEGSGTITLQILECSSTGTGCAGVDGASTITCDSDGATDDGSLSNASIDAGDWVQVLYGAPSGTVNTLTYSIYYSEAQ